MTKYINRQRKRAEKVRFTELKRRQHMSVILETKQLCKFYGAGENQSGQSGGHSD
jgi:putative ABC transport system ATP-binding protein